MQPPEPCVPFTPCWCEIHPNNPHCTSNVPINNKGFIITIIFLIIIYLITKNIFKNISKE
jgi:hypothetical protein